MGIMGNGLVVKHNDLITARYELDLPEQRLVVLLCTQIEKDDVDFKTYRITVDDFASMYGLKKGRLFTEIKRITLGLLDSKIYIKKFIESSGKTKHEHLRWFSYASYIDGEGCIDVRFDPAMKPYLLDLKEDYTKYAAKNIVQLKRNCSGRIYELALKNNYKAKNGVFNNEISISEIREYFNLEENEQKLSGHLIGNIIKPAIEEINKKTDITIRLETIKESRKVVGLKFISSYKEKESPDFEVVELEAKKELGIFPLLDELRGLGIAENTAVSLFTDYAPEVIERNIVYSKKKKPDDLPAYLIAAIRADYAIADHKAEEAKKEAEAKEMEKAEERVKKDKQRVDIFNQKIQSVLDDFWLLPHDEQEKKRDDFEVSLILPAMRKIWNQSRTEHEKPEGTVKHKADFYKFLTKTASDK